MSAKAVNLRNERYDVYIGRGSKWGNPFPMKNSSLAERERVCKLYEEYFMKQPHLIESLPELIGKKLGCYCKPLKCHGDFLAEMANKLEEEMKNEK